MRKGKVYKKFLSCVLATAMVVTSGVVYPGNVKAASVESVETEQDFDSGWKIVAEQYGTGIIMDNQGIMYQLADNGEKATATVIGFFYNNSKEAVDGDSIQSDIVEITIPDRVPLTYTNYKDYQSKGTGVLGAANRESSDVTAIDAEAFLNSSNLTKVIIPESVKSIGDRAFASCPNLVEVEWNVAQSASGEIKIGNETIYESNAKIFENSPKCVLTVPSENFFVKQYIEKMGYGSSRSDDSQPSPSVVPSQEPTAVPSATPAEPTAVPSVEPEPTSIAPTATSSAAPTVVPSATPVTTSSAVPTVAPTPAIATSTPTVTVAPTPAIATSTPIVTVVPTSSVTPSMAPVTPTPVVVTTPPVQTSTPDVTAAPATMAPTKEPAASAPASQEPAATEAPSPVVTQEPENTPVPIQPTKKPVQNEVVIANNVTIEVNKSTKSASVSNMKNTKNSIVKIPATVKVNGIDYPVTSVDKGAFRNNTVIEEVQLGKNIKKIKPGAFRGCKNLKSVKLPSGLETIRKNSFNGCSSLKSIKIPKKVTQIGKGSFKDCTSLKDCIIGGAPGKKTGALTIDGKQVRYGASTVTVDIGKKAFENCKKLNKVIINALVKVIGKSAFKDCKSLRSVLIYSKVLKQVKGGALTGVSNCKISVPTKKVEPYKILFKNKGQGKKVVVAKF